MKLDKYLPIGTVVLLKGAEKKVMITGFLPIDNADGKEVKYDYCGCPYPEGVFTMDEVLLFNHDDIHRIYYLGYSDGEEEEFKARLGNALKMTEEQND